MHSHEDGLKLLGSICISSIALLLLSGPMIFLQTESWNEEDNMLIIQSCLGCALNPHGCLIHLELSSVLQGILEHLAMNPLVHLLLLRN